MTFHSVSLDDKYDLTKDRIFVSGTQAIIRLLLMQKELDRRTGLNTGGFIGGYPGSPLGGVDQQLWIAEKLLKSNDVVFKPGLNEELAATAVWGTQQFELNGKGKNAAGETFDGVYGLWYGKGPGVDRIGDVLRHGNISGSHPNGGVLCLMGDDHTSESSSVAHQSEYAFIDTMIPIFNPAGVQEIVEYGLAGLAMSRFSGTFSSLKLIKDNVEATQSVSVPLDCYDFVRPEVDMPPGGLHVRLAEWGPVPQEERLHRWKIPAAQEFIRANKFNKIVWNGGRSPKIGIVSTGKSYLDSRQALADLGIGEAEGERLGIRILKLATPWPLDYEDFREFADGLEMIVVVEEKRPIIENQLKDAMYGRANAPVIIGKKDEQDRNLFPSYYALDPNDIAITLGERILKVIGQSDEIEARVNRIRQAQARLKDVSDVATRVPTFCSGCPHNSSTKVPDGSRAAPGIGCHAMVIWMGRNTGGQMQMGGEGAQWVGQEPFSGHDHIFQNMGDGTYTHSGLMALRYAVAAEVNITYKILYNGTIAMTGGQRLETGMTALDIANQVRAEGVERIALVSDEPEKHNPSDWPKGTTFDHRSKLDEVQRELREVKGVSVLIYDQFCATEKRRLRKRGKYPDPDKRAFINQAVCEGCGDCGQVSNCVAIQPLETEFGRKRQIDQTACNKDYSCINGFCPSFVTVHGGKLKKAETVGGEFNPLDGVPDITPAMDPNGWSCVITGVGGTGVVTIGAVMGMAAHLEGKGTGIIDMAGLAQKGGGVFSHMRIAATPEDVSAIRVPAGKADLVLGCDLVTSGAARVLTAVNKGETTFVANTAEVMPGDFARNPDFKLPGNALHDAIRATAGDDKVMFFDGIKAAEKLFGNAIGANMFILGMAWQQGAVPLSAEAIEEALKLNGQAIEMNVSAFRWGRRAAHDPQSVLDVVGAADKPKGVLRMSETLDEVIARRVEFLTGYQNARYAKRFEKGIALIREAEKKVQGEEGPLADTAARYLFKLMAIKDEFEVARLYTDGRFEEQMKDQFESWDKIEFHLAPPLIAKKNADGHLIKRKFGPSTMRLFRLMARFKGLRGTPLDIFGYHAERRMERRLLADYEQLLAEVAGNLKADNYSAALALLAYPETIRGYGHVKERHIEETNERLTGLRQAFEQGNPPPALAAE